MNIERVGGEHVEVVARRPIVMAALPLKPKVRQRLGELLEATVVDMRQPVDDPDVVLTPACSPQLIGALKRRFNGAPVVVVELSDWDLDVEIGGPVKRIMAAGADAYVLADSLEKLAGKLTTARETSSAVQWTPHELEPRITMDDLLAAFLNESFEYAQRHRDEQS